MAVNVGTTSVQFRQLRYRPAGSPIHIPRTYKRSDDHPFVQHTLRLPLHSNILRNHFSPMKFLTATILLVAASMSLANPGAEPEPAPCNCEEVLCIRALRILR